MRLWPGPPSPQIFQHPRVLTDFSTDLCRQCESKFCGLCSRSSTLPGPHCFTQRTSRNRCSWRVCFWNRRGFFRQDLCDGSNISTDFPTTSTVPGFKLTSSGAASGPVSLRIGPGAERHRLTFVLFVPGRNWRGHFRRWAERCGRRCQRGCIRDRSHRSTAGTGSANFPVVNGFQTALSGTSGNAFSPRSTQRPRQRRFFPPTSAGTAFILLQARLRGCGVWSNRGFVGNAYLVGTTSSTDLITAHTPTITGFSTSNYPTGNTTNTAFVHGSIP